MNTVYSVLSIAAPTDRTKHLTIEEIKQTPPKYMVNAETIGGKEILGYIIFLTDDYVTIITKKDHIIQNVSINSIAYLHLILTK